MAKRKTRKIGGKTFTRITGRRLKSDAKKAATTVRTRAPRVRVIKDPDGGWGIYANGYRK